MRCEHFLNSHSYSTQESILSGYVCNGTCTVAHRFLNLLDNLFPCQVGTKITGRQETSSHLAHPPLRQDVHCSRYHTTGIVFSHQNPSLSPSRILGHFSINRLSRINFTLTRYFVSCYSTNRSNSKALQRVTHRVI